MPSDESYMPGGYKTAALMVDKSAALQTLVALCRVRVERIQTLTSIARAWSPEGTDGQAQIGFLLEPTAYELEGLLEVIADRAAALEGAAA